MQFYSNSSKNDKYEPSLGNLKSPLGPKLTSEIFGPSGEQERLNWLLKKRLINVINHFFIVSTL